MKFILLLLLLAFTIFSCAESDEEKMRFIRTYKDILMARELYTDTAKAGKEVLLIYKKKGYTETSFRKKYFEYARSGREFLAMLDSARELAQEEALRLESQLKKDSTASIGAPVDTTE